MFYTRGIFLRAITADFVCPPRHRTCILIYFAKKILLKTDQNLKLRETAYFSLVRSFLEYSATVWHPRQKYNSDKLEMVQRRAARFVKGRYGRC